MTSTLIEHVGQRIKEFRTAYGERGISQEALASKIGVATNTISRWETATVKPTIEDLEKLARFFGKSIEEFFHRSEVGPNLRQSRAAYFNDECGVSVMLARGLPDEPTIFSMAHELKHHLVDKNLMVTLCGPTDNPRIADDRNAIEIGAEVFAAEFIYPEADFVRDFEKIGGPCNPKALVKLKEATSTSLSYQAMVKRSLRLGLLHYTDELRFAW